MSDKLKIFIQEHRQELDVVEPSQDLWNRIDNRLDLNKTSWIKSKGFSALKIFGFSASVFIIAFLLFNTNKSEVNITADFKKQINNNVIKTEEPDLSGDGKQAIALQDPKKQKEEKAEIAVVSSLYPEASETKTDPSLIVAADPVTENISTVTPDAVPYTDPVQNQDSKTETKSRSKGKRQIIADTLFTGIKRLEVNVCCFDINVEASQDDKVHVKGEIYTESKGLVLNKLDYKIKYERKDSVLTITVDKSGGNTLIVGVFKQESDLRFTVPINTDVEIKNGSGNIFVGGLRGRSCRIKSSYGDVEMSDVQSEVEIKLTSGDLNLKNVTGKIKSETSFGNQTYENITGNLTLKSSSGDIELRAIKGDINVVSTYGDVRLDKSKGNLLINIQSGDIVGRNVEVTDNSQFKTQYGDIKVGLDNNFNDLTFDLQAVFGDLKINKGNQVFKSEEGKLHLDQGKITITGYSHSGDQYYE